MKNSKFEMLYETIYTRFKQGAGFLEGDVVKLKSDYKSTEGYKTLTDSVRQRLDDASKSGYNLRLGRLHTPNNNAGALGINVGLPATHADLYEEKSPGNFGNLVTVPVDLLEVVDTGVNLAPVSKNNKGLKSEVPYQQPGKWKSNPDTPETEEQNHMGHEQNWVPKGDYKLADKDKKSSVGANKYDDDKPSKFKPLPKNKVITRESKEALENAYLRILTEDTDVEDTEEVITPSDVERDNDIETENMSVAAPEITESKIKPECWDRTKNTVIDEYWGPDGKVKAECWQNEAMAEEDTDAGLAQGGNVVAPEEGEQTGALEETSHDLPSLEDLKNMPQEEIIPTLRSVRKSLEGDDASGGTQKWLDYILPLIKAAQSKDPEFYEVLKNLMNAAAAEKKATAGIEQ